MIGLVTTSGLMYIPQTSLYFLSLVTFYFIINKYIQKDRLKVYMSYVMFPAGNIPLYILFILSLLFVFFHIIYLDGIPAFEALKSKSTLEVVNIRRAITSDSNSFWNYFSSIHIKALMPFLLLLLLLKKRYALYGIYLCVVCFYAIILMQKSYILTVLAPVIIISILRKKTVYFVKCATISALVIVALVYISNPIMRGGYDDEPKIELEKVENSDLPYIVRVVIGLNKRMFITPGEIVSKWFDNIPENKPFLYGKGYRLLNKFTNTEYIDYSKELYPFVSPQYAKRGFKGSVNTASFMYDYSNFGITGLVFSGFMLALLLYILEQTYLKENELKVSLNFFHVFMLSSGALTTALFSGGWGFINVFFILFYKQFKGPDE